MPLLHLQSIMHPLPLNSSQAAVAYCMPVISIQAAAAYSSCS